MTIISDTQARAHLRIVTGEDDGNLANYTAAAELSAQLYMNRNVYASDSDLAAAIAAAPAALATAAATYQAAQDAIGALPTDSTTQYQVNAMQAAANIAWSEAQAAYRRTLAGIVTNDLILSGALLILGHLFSNREDVVADYRITPLQVPMASQYLLNQYRVQMGVC